MNKSDSTLSDFGILIHGGAGTEKIKKSSKRAKDITNSLVSSVCNGFEILRKENGTAVDAVESAVANMENSGVFNAGLGSCLTVDKQIEMDASIMNGKDISVGSVGMVQNIQNPIKLARLVMESTDHVMFVSEGANKLAKLLGMEFRHYKISQQKLKTYNKYYKKQMKSTWRKNNQLLTSHNNNNNHYGTVGAVAIDRKGNVASAISSGGRWLKIHGRIGDSAIVGAGIYADNGLGAACATGVGEFIIRLCLSKYACDYMVGQNNNNAFLSSNMAIAKLTQKFGENTGGIITVDTKGQFGAAMNTKSMPIALCTSKTKKVKVALNEHKRFFDIT
jgi:beta-aspartyl-peptidase (threonine type)